MQMSKTFNLENVPGTIVKFTQEHSPSAAVKLSLDVSDQEKLRKSLDAFFPGATNLSQAISADESPGVDVSMRGTLVDVKLEVRVPGRDEPLVSMSMARVKGAPKLLIGDKAKSMRIETTVAGVVARAEIVHLWDAVKGAADCFVDIAASQMDIDDAIEDHPELPGVDGAEEAGDSGVTFTLKAKGAKVGKPVPKPSAKKKKAKGKKR